jgi:hypothetical protein
VISVKWIAVGRLHVLSVVQPDIVSFLSSKDSKCSANDNTGNNNDCQETSRDTNDGSSAQSKDARLAITIAHLAGIDLSAWDLIDIASISIL